MASNEHPVSRVFPIAAWAIASVLGLVFLGACFLRKKRGKHGNSCKTNVEIEKHQRQQQQPQEESEGSHNIPSTSSSIDPEIGHEFEVFLSFRGSDNRKKFTDHLYHGLKDAGIRAFRDDKELRVGEEIGPELMKSIKQSKIAIPIFSKDYASSKWCLKEVAEMVKCMKETKQQIMPVFLDVTPDEVQHQTGNYARPFAAHEKQFGREMVGVWRDALLEVVKLKGLELDTVANGNEGQFVRFIVARVIRQLKKSYLEVGDKLVGIEDRAKELRKKLEVDIDDVRFVGVWGMGGIGKTTLAKFVYNQIVDKFDCSCFLSNIRETSPTRGLPYLQSKLASDILRSEPEDYSNVEEGINVLKERLRHKKALILLDDVDSNEQLKNLAADAKWFDRGSRIIITTREKAVLDKFGVQDPYEVALLDEDQALELFCGHAFGDRFPRADFTKLTRDIVDRTGRLPLALEVIGSHLSTYCGRKDKDKAMWKDTLAKLRLEPNQNVQVNLKISYDSLENNEREIFLDIACFFIGIDQRLVKPMWIAPTMGIEILLLKSLIKINEDNRIWMHDLLRDLGRCIVEQENSKDLGQRSRLWRGEDAADVLEQLQGPTKVEAIRLERRHLVENQVCLSDEKSKNMPNLRILELYGVRLKGSFPKVRWLSWHPENNGSSWENQSPPEDLTLKNIIVLDLSRSSIPQNYWSSIKTGVELKVLNLKSSGISSTPDFSAFPSLEILILRLCGRLTQVDPSIGRLRNLILLDLSYCSSLEALPEQIGSMESLVEFLIDRTRLSKVPISSSMKELKILSAKNCNSLQLPDLSKLQMLSSLFITNCKGITEIPGLQELSQLQVLDIYGCKALNNLPDLSKLQRLSYLNISLCEKIIEIPQLEELSQLPGLDIRECKALKKLPDLSKLQRLSHLNILHCEGLTEISELEEQSQLQVLEIRQCKALNKLPDLSKLQRLSRLIILHCEGITEISELEEQSQLQVLEIRQCKALKKLPDLSKLQRLSRLNTALCEDIPEIPGLGELSQLEVLDIYGCKALKKLPDLSKLQRLSRLNTAWCEDIPEIPGLGELSQLEVLDIHGCKALNKLPDLSKLQRLSRLNTAMCEDIPEIPGLGELSQLEVLDIHRCKALKKLPDLSKLQRLPRLYIVGCEDIPEIPGLGELSQLEFLDIHRCKALKKLPDLSKLQRLSHLNTAMCENIPEIPGLGELSQLKVLDIHGCKALNKLPDLSKLQRLSRLNTAMCEDIPEIPGLGELSQLEVLDIHGCKAFNKLPDLSKLQRLFCLNTAMCENILEIPGLGELSQLEVLDINGCKALNKLPDLSKLQRLSCLNSTMCENILEIPGLGELSQLQVLDINGCKAHNKLPDLSKLQRLSCLYIAECEDIPEIPGLGELSQLQVLKIQKCKALKKLSDLSKLQRLSHIDISSCEDVTEIPGLEELSQLCVIVIKECKALKKLPDLSKLQWLSHLDISGCEDVTKIPGLEELCQLQILNVEGCKALKLPDLSKQESNGLKIYTE